MPQLHSLESVARKILDTPYRFLISSAASTYAESGGQAAGRLQSLQASPCRTCMPIIGWCIPTRCLAARIWSCSHALGRSTCLSISAFHHNTPPFAATSSGISNTWSSCQGGERRRVKPLGDVMAGRRLRGTRSIGAKASSRPGGPALPDPGPPPISTHHSHSLDHARVAFRAHRQPLHAVLFLLLHLECRCHDPHCLASFGSRNQPDPHPTAAVVQPTHAAYPHANVAVHVRDKYCC